jgi:type II restriction enzyme
MRLLMDSGKAAGFKSAAQIVRVLSEDWAATNLYCPACDSDSLTRARNNTRVLDFICPLCSAPFQLKSSKRWDERRIPDAGYSAMMEAISLGRNPNLVVMHYDRNWAVRNLLLIPSFFLSASAIQKRRPLAATARRAGWIGCNIVLSSIPTVGRIVMVANGLPRDSVEVRLDYSRASPFSSLDTKVRGWALDVLRIVELLPRRFALSDVYIFEGQLARLHPANKNVRPKIRQQLQVLRDLGFVEFLGGGRYLRS